MTLSNNYACIDDASNCLVQGTSQVAISNSGRLTLVNGQYGTTGTSFTTFTQNIPSSTLMNWGASQLVTGTVNLAYNGLGMLNITLTSSLGDAYHSVQAFDMSWLTAGSVHVGFTAGTGLSTQTAYIENWQMTTNTVPEPSTVALMAAGMLAIGGLAARSRKMQA